MTEKEKMLNGLMYDANYDEELKQERTICKNLCHKYNNLDYDNIQEKKEIIRKLFGKTKENFHIEPYFYCDYGYNISIGENFYSNHNLIILDPAKVTFGDNVFIGPNCGFYTAEHPINATERNKGLEYAKEISVGSDVWFGGNVTVLGGVKIGNNCVIGAGSLILHDIPDNSIAAGNPARVIKKINQ